VKIAGLRLAPFTTLCVTDDVPGPVRGMPALSAPVAVYSVAGVAVLPAARGAADLPPHALVAHFRQAAGWRNGCGRGLVSWADQPDGRLMAVETTVAGQLPDVVTLPETEVYVGASDIPAPAVEHVHVRADGPDGEVLYQYRDSKPRMPG
jgi:hypothetical protein